MQLPEGHPEICCRGLHHLGTVALVAPAALIAALRKVGFHKPELGAPPFDVG